MPGARLSVNEVELIYFNYYNGKTVIELSKMFSVSRQTIYNIVNRAENEGRVEAKPVNGRPKKLTRRLESNLLKKIDENPQISLRSIKNELINEHGIQVSHETIRQTLKNHKYSSRVARKKPLLSQQNIDKRLFFANNYISQPEEFWDDVIFCDETKIMLYHHEGPGRVWRKPLTALEQKNIIPTIKFGKLSVMVWSCFCSGGVGDLVFIEGNMDATQYLNILKENLVRSAKKFQNIQENSSVKPILKLYQDNDPKHKALDVRTWLLYNCQKVFDTPAQSPDLNPIENLWAHLKKKVAKRSPKNRQQLKEIILEEWLKIPEDYDLKKLTRSMNNRLRAVIKVNGYHTKY